MANNNFIKVMKILSKDIVNIYRRLEQRFGISFNFPTNNSWIKCRYDKYFRRYVEFVYYVKIVHLQISAIISMFYVN